MEIIADQDRLGTCSANQTSAPPPNAAACRPPPRRMASSPRRSAGCAACARPRPPPHAPSGCRTPSPGTGPGGLQPSASGRSTTTASIVARSSLQSGTLAPSMTTPSGRPAPSAIGLVLVPGLPRSVGLRPTSFPPEPGLAQSPVATLPLPVDPAQVVAGGRQQAPQPLEEAVPAEALEPAMHRPIAAEALGHLVPLAPGPHAEDDAVDDRAEAHPWPPGGLGAGNARRAATR